MWQIMYKSCCKFSKCGNLLIICNIQGESGGTAETPRMYLDVKIM
jgi:hypothetical protein